tara:strand:- start:14390 stop:14776 length:387 start_codon:yes stop_codon:yes gene_type:complete
MPEMSRQERISLHKKQELTQVKNGEPSSNDLQEGVPSIRQTSEGVIEYIKHNGSLIKRNLTPSASISNLVDRTGGIVSDSITNYVGVANNSSATTKVSTVEEVENSVASLVFKINLIIKTLREQNLIS